MKNSLRRIFALLMAVMMIAALGMSAFAADEGTPASYVLNVDDFKTLNKDANAHAPKTTFTFSATPYTGAGEGANGTVATPYAGPAGAVNIDDITSAPADTDIAAAGQTPVTTLTYDGKITITQVAGFNKAGIYRYIVEEVVPAEADVYKGITYSTEDRYLDVYVASDDDGVLSIQGAVLYEIGANLDSGEDDAKSYDAKGGFTNSYDTANLTLTKKVSGNLGDQTKDFTFTVVITGAVGEKYHVTTTNDDAEVTDLVIPTGEEGATTGTVSATFTLAHGENVIIYGLSEGDIYTITENDYSADGYTTTVSVDSAEATETNTTTDTLDAATDVNILFTNNKSANVPTGIAMTVLPFVAMIALAAIVAVLFFQKRERREA